MGNWVRHIWNRKLWNYKLLGSKPKTSEEENSNTIRFTLDGLKNLVSLGIIIYVSRPMKKQMMQLPNALMFNNKNVGFILLYLKMPTILVVLEHSIYYHCNLTNLENNLFIVWHYLNIPFINYCKFIDFSTCVFLRLVDSKIHSAIW